MPDPVTAGLIVGPLSAAITGIVAYMLGRREHSGQIATTDADRLWEQNGLLIKSLTSERDSLQIRVHDLEVAQRKSEESERECNARADRLALKVDALERALKIEPAGG